MINKRKNSYLNIINKLCSIGYSSSLLSSKREDKIMKKERINSYLKLINDLCRIEYSGPLESSVREDKTNSNCN
jgi:hypothetical protein